MGHAFFFYFLTLDLWGLNHVGAAVYEKVSDIHKICSGLDWNLKQSNNGAVALKTDFAPLISWDVTFYDWIMPYNRVELNLFKLILLQHESLMMDCEHL